MIHLSVYVTVALTCPLLSSVADAGSKSARPPRGPCSRSRRRHCKSGMVQVPVCPRYPVSRCTQPGSQAWGTKLYWGLAEYLRGKNWGTNWEASMESSLVFLRFTNISHSLKRNCNAIFTVCLILANRSLFCSGRQTKATSSSVQMQTETVEDENPPTSAVWIRSLSLCTCVTVWRKNADLEPGRHKP